MKKEDDNKLTTAVLSIDLEDYYHGNYPGYDYKTLERKTSRVVEPTMRILNILGETNSRATFFVLGEVARAYPELIRRIAEDNHEIASHGEQHLLLIPKNKKSTIEGLVSTMSLLEDISGKRVLGYRAPNFSAHSRRTPWLFEALSDIGIIYDSSRFPAKIYYGGEPFMLKEPHIMILPNGARLWEVPVSVLGPAPFRLVWSGGFYWRIFPLDFIEKRVVGKTNSEWPAVLFLHPKDLDEENPPLPVGRISNWIHNVGTKDAFRKFERMCARFRFIPIKDIIPRGEYVTESETIEIPSPAKA